MGKKGSEVRKSKAREGFRNLAKDPVESSRLEEENRRAGSLWHEVLKRANFKGREGETREKQILKMRGYEWKRGKFGRVSRCPPTTKKSWKKKKIKRGGR